MTNPLDDLVGRDRDAPDELVLQRWIPRYYCRFDCRRRNRGLSGRVNRPKMRAFRYQAEVRRVGLALSRCGT